MLGNARRRQGKHYLLWNRNASRSAITQKQPTIPSPEQPTITFPEQLALPSQKQPTHSSQKQLTRPSQKQPTITSPQQSTISTSILESATTQQMALTTAESCSQPDSTLLQRHHPNLSFEDMQQQLHSVPSSASWTPVYSASSIQLCMVKVAPMSQSKVERSITVNTDMSWHVHITGKLVPIATNKVLRDFPCRISEVKCLQHIMECVERAHICPPCLLMNPSPREHGSTNTITSCCIFN